MTGASPAHCYGAPVWVRHMVVADYAAATGDTSKVGSRPVRVTTCVVVTREVGKERDEMLRKQFLETSRGRIAALLQRGGFTAEEIASQLGLTTNAIRAQLTAMERDGLVRRVGQKRGATRPSHLFELTREVEQLLSGMYVPMLIHLVRVFTKTLRSDQLRKIMLQAGRSLADDFPRAKRHALSLGARASAANDLLMARLGAVTHIDRKGRGFVIRGAACPIAAITGRHPSACLMVEGFLQEIVGTPVRECCDRNGRPRCCFEITPSSQKSQ